MFHVERSQHIKRPDRTWLDGVPRGTSVLQRPEVQSAPTRRRRLDADESQWKRVTLRYRPGDEQRQDPVGRQERGCGSSADSSILTARIETTQSTSMRFHGSPVLFEPCGLDQRRRKPDDPTASRRKAAFRPRDSTITSSVASRASASGIAGRASSRAQVHQSDAAWAGHAAAADRLDEQSVDRLIASVSDVRLIFGVPAREEVEVARQRIAERWSAAQPGQFGTFGKSLESESVHPHRVSCPETCAATSATAAGVSPESAAPGRWSRA